MTPEHDDVLNELEHDTRRLIVSKLLANRPLTDAEIVQAIDNIRRYLKVAKIPYSSVSKQMGKGFSTSVISNILGVETEGDVATCYKGDVEKKVRALNKFIENHDKQAKAPKVAGFVETAVAKRCLLLIKNVCSLRGIGLIYGPAGHGKTMTLLAAQSQFPGSIYIRINQGSRSFSGVAELLCEQLRLATKVSTRRKQQMITNKLRGSNRLLLIDEAHKMDRNALEFIRDLYDECEIAVVLCGTRDIDKNVSDRDVFYGQFSSRISMRYDIAHQLTRDDGPGKPVHTVAEIRKVFESGSVKLTTDGAQELARLANLPGLGALRICREVVHVAATAAKGAPIDADRVLRVVAQMHGIEFSNYVKDRKRDLRVRVA